MIETARQSALKLWNALGYGVTYIPTRKSTPEGQSPSVLYNTSRFTNNLVDNLHLKREDSSLTTLLGNYNAVNNESMYSNEVYTTTNTHYL